ncbi:hypothetical protein C8R44DRAFT_866853 [Mycena epipterygia]|nr:hypothetical protein C8R44DRAFT_866853 [Mycena epipterygia]
MRSGESWALPATTANGQILIDKRGNDGLNLAALHVAVHMVHEQLFYYSLSEGDEDTFRYAFWALGPAGTGLYPRATVVLHGKKVGDRFCGIGVLQPIFTLVQRPLFDVVEPESHDLDGTTVNMYRGYVR